MTSATNQNESKSSQSTSQDSPPTENESQRASRLNEYESQVLRSNKPLAAVLGAANCDLLRLHQQQGDAISIALGKGKTPTLDSMKSVLPAFDTHLKYARQIDRMTQIAIRLEEQQQS